MLCHACRGNNVGFWSLYMYMYMYILYMRAVLYKRGISLLRREDSLGEVRFGEARNLRLCVENECIDE